MKFVKSMGLALTLFISVSACTVVNSKSKSISTAQKPSVSSPDLSAHFAKHDAANSNRLLIRTIREGDLIITQSIVTTAEGESNIVGGLLRIKDGEFDSEWEVLQKAVPKEKTANGNSMIDGAGDVNKQRSKSELERNKKTILDFIHKGFAQGDKETLATLFGEEYIQHNPRVPNGKEVVLSFIPKQGQGFPAKIMQIVAQGDLVAALVEYGTAGTSFHNSAVDIFRMDDNGKVVEHWDVVSKMPK